MKKLKKIYIQKINKKMLRLLTMKTTKIHEYTTTSNEIKILNEKKKKYQQ